MTGTNLKSNNGKSVAVRPVFLCACLSAAALVFTGGAIYLTDQIGFAVMFAGLWIALWFVAKDGRFNQRREANLPLMLMSIPTGILFALARNNLNDRISGVVFLAGGVAVIMLFASLFGWAKEDKGFAATVMLLGVWLRLSFIMIVPYYAMSNDIGEFEDSYNVLHSGYIEFVRFTWRTPNLDIRDFAEWYHPPVYYFAAAAILNLQELLLPSRATNWEGLQCLTLFCSNVTMWVIVRLAKHLKLKGDGLKVVSVLAAFTPALVMLSGNLNNDSMGLMFAVSAVCLIFRWQQDRTYTNLVQAALAMGLAVSTKLSGAMAAIPVATILAATLIKQNKKLRTLWQCLIYGIVSLPVGLWFYLKNCINFGVPVTYVPESTNSLQYVGDRSLIDRLFDFSTFAVEDVFIRPGYEGKPDCGIFATLIKTGLFNEAILRDKPQTALPAWLLVIVFAWGLLLAAAGIVYAATHVKNAKEAALALWFLANAAGYVKLVFDYPYTCSMNFRYVLPAYIVSALGLGALCMKHTKFAKVASALTYVFAGLVLVFYCGVATYFV